jgi:hypothetical protein
MNGRSRKVHVDLMGGIGNQLFIYFAGLYLAKKCKSDLILLTNLLESTNESHPGRGIEGLGLPGTFTSRRSPFYTFIRRVSNFMKRRLGFIALVFFRQSRNYLSDQVGFDEKLVSLTPPCHIHGYFQTWKYTEESISEIKKVLDDYKAGSVNSSELIAESLSKLPIVVHIRLGDYRDEINGKFGVMGAEYYSSALKLVMNMPEMAEREIWVYSDSIKEARELYSGKFPARSRWVDESHQIDNLDIFIAMRNASAHIIGNSSFSWWAAYSSSCTKMVIAPRKWFKNMPDPRDLCPSNWNQIDSSWYPDK